MPIHMRLPKRGFNKPNRKKLNAVNLGRLQLAIEAGKLEKGSTVSAATLLQQALSVVSLTACGCSPRVN